MRKVFLDNLPKRGKFIDWKNSIGYTIKFVYEEIEDEVMIYDYISQSGILILKYNDRLYDISINHIYKGALGRIVGKITNEFKIEINALFKDDNRDFIILDREYRLNKKGYNRKWYKYKCNKCGYEGWIDEGNIFDGHGCLCCTNQIVVPGINDITTTDPWMVKYFQGGYDETKQYTHGSTKRIHAICPDCGTIKDKSIKISDIYKHRSIGCVCQDNYSMPEKFMYFLLKELNINFIFQLSSNDLSWCENYRYDFYLIDENSIIETHGEQHYEYTGFKRTLEEEKENDKNKEELALRNNISKYIVIDCRKSELDWIKNNIINSELSNLYDLSNIDWMKIYEKSFKNLIKEVCEYYESHKELTQQEIAKIFNIKPISIIKYLKIGEKCGWCSNVKERSKNAQVNGMIKKNSKKILCIELNLIFDSIEDCNKQLSKLFNKKFSSNGISRVAKGKQKQHNGLTFKFI